MVERTAVEPRSRRAHRAVSNGDRPTLRLQLLGAFALTHDHDVVPVPHGSEQLLAFVALRGHTVGRAVVAGTLWPEVTEQRAFATLRSALARLNPISRDALFVDHVSLCVADGVAVDLHEAQALALRLLDPTVPCDPSDLTAATIGVLTRDLLDGWYDDWSIFEAEAWRQVRLHALEVLASELSLVRRFGLAIVAAAAAVRADPLRESAHAALIRVHLAEGNQGEARREFEQFRALLRDELGVEPTAKLRALAGAS